MSATNTSASVGIERFYITRAKRVSSRDRRADPHRRASRSRHYVVSLLVLNPRLFHFRASKLNVYYEHIHDVDRQLSRLIKVDPTKPVCQADGSISDRVEIDSSQVFHPFLSTQLPLFPSFSLFSCTCPHSSLHPLFILPQFYLILSHSL